MLVNMKEMLRLAEAGHYAVGLFNVVNLEMAKGVIAAAEKAQVPVIIGAAERMLKVISLEELSYFLLPMARKASIPVAVHLDHGAHGETCMAAMELGFTSVMLDCSKLPFEENVQKMAALTAVAHEKYGATVEGELGCVLGEEGSHAQVDATMSADMYTDPDKAYEYVTRTGIDALAIAVGTAHGLYKGEPHIAFERIREIRSKIDTPLVLHGGTGLSDSVIQQAIDCGISKINIFTEINLAGANALKDGLQNGQKGMMDLIPTVSRAVEETALKSMQIFSKNRS